MEKRKKILYLTTVTWRWIKQRPQFLAEELSKDFDVDVYYKQPTKLKKSDLVTKIPESTSNLYIKSFRIIPFYNIPGLRKLNLNFVNNWLLRMQIPSFENYDIIWYATPLLYPFTKARISSKNKVVYDCMDDAAAFPSASYESVIRREAPLVIRCDLTIFSSEYLKNVVFKRSNITNKFSVIVNNALKLNNEYKITDLPQEVKEKIGKVKSLSKPLIYIGTISEWFNFDSMINVLEKNSDYNLVLFGPTNKNVPEHKQIYHFGALEHKYIYSVMPLAYALVMPFKIIELIKSVNPVKLYEYIYSGRPVVVPRYGETEVFSEFVHLYDNDEQFIEIIKGFEGFESSDEYIKKCHEFVIHNTWSDRYIQIKEYLDKLF